MKSVKTHTFRGRRWQFVISRMRSALGMCESPTGGDKKLIVASSEVKQGGLSLLDTLIHESLHACFWDLDEEAVHAAAHDIARFLWRIGYRLPPMKKG